MELHRDSALRQDPAPAAHVSWGFVCMNCHTGQDQCTGGLGRSVWWNL